MKKLIALALVFAALLMLASCKNAAIDPKYEDIIERLENKDYDGAIRAIEELKYAPETDEDGKEIETQMSVDDMKYLYQNMIGFIDGYNPGYYRESYSVYDSVVGESFEYDNAEEVFDYVIGRLGELGDYEDAKDYIDRVYKCKDVLLYTKSSYTDAFGAEHSLNTVVYNYDRDGKIIYESSGYDISNIFGNSSFAGSPSYEYGEDGKLTKVTFTSGETLYSIVEYKYTGELLTTMTYKANDGEVRDVEFKYDKDGRIIERSGVDINLGYDDDTCTFKYEYDDNGRLVREIAESSDNHKEIYTYKYDGDGKLIYKEKSRGNYNGYGADHKVSPPDYTGWEYTYDEEGRLLTVTELDLGYLDADRNQVNYSGEPVTDPDLEFPKITTYYYGVYCDVEE